MTAHVEFLRDQIRLACQGSGAPWAAWVQLNPNRWQIGAQVGLGPDQRAELEQLLTQPGTSAWLSSVYANQKRQSRSNASRLSTGGAGRLYAFPASRLAEREPELLLVGGNKLDRAHLEVFSFIAKNTAPAEAAPPAPPSSETFVLPEAGDVRLRTSRNLDNFQLLTEMAEAAAAGADTDQVARSVVHGLQRTFNTDLVAVFLLSADGKMLREYGAEPGSTPRVIPVETSLAGYTAETGIAVRADEVSQAPRFLPQGRPVRSVLAVPLKYQGKLIGTLMVESSEPAAFNEVDEKLLMVIASHLAGMLEYSRRYQELQTRLTHLQAVHDTALEVSRPVELEVLLNRVVRRACDLAKGKAAIVGLLDQERDAVKVAAFSNPWHKEVDFSNYRLESGVIGRIIKNGTAIRVSDYPDWPERSARGSCLPITALAGVPLRLKDEVIGSLLVMDDTEGREFTDEDIRILELLASQVAIAIHNARLFQELQQRVEELRRAEASLLRSAQLAAVGEMAAEVAHEINNPLTTIMGFVELALRELPKDLPQYPELGIVHSEAKRAQAVVRRMLDLSRKRDMQTVSLDLNLLTEETLRLVQYSAEDGKIDICFNQAAGLPPVLVEPSQIKQVMLNLVHNAVQAMPDGGKLTLETRLEPHHGRHGISLYVSDTGHGIDPEILPHIFDPFFTTRPPGCGTGLGLAISYAIVSNHGGFIDVNSKPGQGSCFQVWLPAAQEGPDA